MGRVCCDLCGRAAPELVAACRTLRVVFLCKPCDRAARGAPLLPFDQVETPHGSR